MTRLVRWLQHLGPRVFISYLILSAAAAVTGLLATFLVPPAAYHRLMLQVMHPPRGATAAQMDAVLAKAISRAILEHVALSLAVAVAVAVPLTAVVSMAIGSALARVTAATRRLAEGAYDASLPHQGIAEIAELYRQVNLLAASLAAARERRRLAIASMSHELRSPLTALRAYLDGAREGVVPMTPEVLERMALSVERLERMAADLTTLAQVEEGRLPAVTLRILEVGEVLDAAYRVALAAYQDRGVLLVLAPPPPGLTVHADPVRLGEVVDNLLSNSLAHTPPGRQVTLGARPLGPDRVELFVADEGEGISPEDLPRVTEPFYRGRGSAGHTPRPGMGLGLTIARDLVRAMGGQLRVESPGLGHGTVARVVLPRSAPPPA